mmetsp:Transcript_92925/g.268357  ORF Transcript_92925/g.268357 Transcript_92925/m.268357 type:complete len:565 (+) Transcript_92925:118-1812(+)
MGACGSSSPATVPGGIAASCSKAEPLFRERIVRRRSGNITDYYTLDDHKLGEGTFGIVHRGVHKLTGTTCAVKTVPMGNVTSLAGFRREASIMKTLDHPNIIRLYETFEDSEHVHLAMELCRGGELFDRVIALGHLSERQAATVMQDVLRAVLHMHEKGIAHRDLKPENFLFASQRPIEQNVLKVIDFGTARQCGPNTIMSSIVGTRFYVAPQVLTRRYCRKCDTWSCGSILYALLSGKPAFTGRTDQEVLMKVRTGKYSLEGNEWSSVSEEAKRFIRQLMHMNPRARYTAQQALEHNWIRKKAMPVERLSVVTDNLVDNLRDFHLEPRLKKAALQVIATHLREEQLSRLRGAFLAMDLNGDGLLTMDEMRQSISNPDLDQETQDDLARSLQAIDIDESGSIDYTEFIAASLDRSEGFSDKQMQVAFNTFDLDGDGSICLEELKSALGVRREVSEEVVRSLDGDGDGRISFEEFKAMMCEACKGPPDSSLNDPIARRRTPNKPQVQQQPSPRGRKGTESTCDMEVAWTGSATTACTRSTSDASMASRGAGVATEVPLSVAQAGA